MLSYMGPLGMLGVTGAFCHETPRHARGDRDAFAMRPLDKLGVTGALPWDLSASSR